MFNSRLEATIKPDRNFIKLKRIIFCILILYFLLGLSTEIFLRQEEKIFPPFFSWFLFVDVPNETFSNESTILLLEVNGQKFSPPVPWGEVYGHTDQPSAARSRTLMQRLANSLEKKNQEETKRLRTLFEQRYLPESVTYQVVVNTYNPIERFKTGKFSTKILGEFRKGQ